MIRASRLLLLAALAAGAFTAVPAQSAPTALCLVISDSQGDPSEIESPNEARAAEPLGDSADPATDVRAVRLGMSGDRLVTEIRVTDIGYRVTDLSSMQRSSDLRWELTWRNPSGEIVTLVAERTGRQHSFKFTRNMDSGAAGGAIDARRNVVRIEAPTALLGIADGDRITEIQAITSELTGPAEQKRDYAPDTTDYGVAYVAGVACAEQDVRACPVVLDRSRDAGTLARVAQQDVPDSPQAVDLLGAGATADADTVRLTVRVINPTAPPPAGYSKVGWTVSWWDGKQKWYAQGVRSKSGMSFGFGIDGSNDAAATGPVFGGLATTGRIERVGYRRVVEIDVPRAFFGDSVDGTLWTRFAATAWALTDTDADELGPGDASPFRVYDETKAGRWRVGVACGA